MTAADQGATIINYMSAEGLLKENGKICGVMLRDSLEDTSSGSLSYEVKAKAVVNATGVFTDSILKMDDAKTESLVTLSQGIHIVLDREFLPSETAIMIPRTDDKRVLFAVPWHNKIIVGTTDTQVKDSSPEPKAMEEEVEFVLHHIQRYLTKDPDRSDIRSVFAGLRPLVREHSKTTAALSRDHHITVSHSELITITGGKWTTYRKMAEDVLEIVVPKAGLADRDCRTKDLHIHGYKKETDFNKPLYYYGSDEQGVRSIVASDKTLSKQIHPVFPFINAEILWAVRNEMCMKVEDFLARRTRALLLDAKASIESAPLVAEIMAKELNKNEDWIKHEIDGFNSIAKNYLPTPNNKQQTTI